MSSFHESQTLSIAQQARIDHWDEMRKQIRSRMIRLVLSGTGYLLISFLIGALFIEMMGSVARETVYLRGWQATELEVEWMSKVILLYALAAGLVTITSAMVLLFIGNRIPAWLCNGFFKVPFIGPTLECLAAAELCQSVYQSVITKSTYFSAFEKASGELKQPGVVRWAGAASSRLEDGEVLSDILKTIPLSVPPLAILSSVFKEQGNPEHARRSWENAAAELHRLAQSRFERTRLFVSNVILLISAFIASYAIYYSSSFMLLALRGLT